MISMTSVKKSLFVNTIIHTGWIYVTNVKGLYKLKENDQTKYQLYLSQNIISKELTQSYTENNKSTLRDFIIKDHNLDISDLKNEKGETNGIQFELTLTTDDRNQISETGFYLVKKNFLAMKKYWKNIKMKPIITTCIHQNGIPQMGIIQNCHGR